ncbi:MAG: c-type cytochrome [Pseudomonadota bacterium]
MSAPGPRGAQLGTALRRLALCALAPLLANAAPAPDPVRGQQLYLEGRVAGEAPITATTQNDIPFSGAQISCVSCHRSSGYGGSEGGNYVLPITGPTLFHPRELDRTKIFNKLFKENQTSKFDARLRSPGMRAAYTDSTLAGAIRTGVDPAGRVLNRLMPRYQLSERDMGDLIAYLRTLSAQPDAGVDSKKLYLATVVSAQVDPAQRAAMLETMRRFVDWHNLQADGDRQHPNFSPNYHSTWIGTYRNWELDTWELNGSSDTWPAQLAAYYAKKPVFAVVSGMVAGSWAPVHQFCEREKLPCLYPHTDLPGMDPKPAYSIYFTRGLALEADVVSRHLLERRGEAGVTRVRQLYVVGAGGSVPANVVAARLAGAPSLVLESQSLGSAPALLAELDKLAGGDGAETLVLWPGPHAALVTAWLARHAGLAKRIYLPSAALDTVLALDSAVADERLLFSFPYELPDVTHPRAFVVRAWMRSRGMDIAYPRLQFDTYFAMTMLQFGMEEIIGVFSRDYFMESLEHLAESNLNPGTYPSMSLGPGQRFASRGAHIVRLTGNKDSVIAPLSAWIVP